MPVSYWMSEKVVLPALQERRVRSVKWDASVIVSHKARLFAIPQPVKCRRFAVTPLVKWPVKVVNLFVLICWLTVMLRSCGFQSVLTQIQAGLAGVESLAGFSFIPCGLSSRCNRNRHQSMLLWTNRQFNNDDHFSLDDEFRRFEELIREIFG